MNIYASFWQRFVAMWVDLFVLLPLIAGAAFLESRSKGIAFALVIPMSLLFAAYTIYLHARSGQTIGKRAMRIRVVRTAGERIGWREAWLRSSVDLFFAVATIIGSFIALAVIPDSEYYGVGWPLRSSNLAAHQPPWIAWTGTALQIWVWSEVLVMLFNKRRRALHDFIAGTVVISEE